MRLLNAIFMALSKCGMKPQLRGKEARGISIEIGDQLVPLFVDSTDRKVEPAHMQHNWFERQTENIKICILSSFGSLDCLLTWQDEPGQKLEKRLKEIVTQIIVSGETRYRNGRQRNFEWLVRRKAEIIDERKRRKEEEERLERKRQIQLEKDKVQRLLDDADKLLQADKIRQYVEIVKTRISNGNSGIPVEKLITWVNWAIAQADRIDPVLSGQFFENMEELDSNH